MVCAAIDILTILSIQYDKTRSNRTTYEAWRKPQPAVSIPWTSQAVKEQLWKPIQKALYNKDSTTELEKLEEIDKTHATPMRHLGQSFGLEHIEFPHDPEKISNYVGVK